MHPPARRSAGLLLPAFSPRRAGDLGIGDTLALRGWIDWAADHKLGFLQLLPINENGSDESPYSAVSSIALDPIYLAIEAEEIPMLAVEEIRRAREALGEAATAARIDYPAVRRAKRNLLELSWSRFGQAEAILREEFEDFREREADWLADHAMFRMLAELFGEGLSWDDWPEGCHRVAGARAFVEKRRRQDAEAVADREGFHAYSQWLCFRQWRALRAHADLRGVRLMGDLPIGVSRHSSDVFFRREDFHLDWCGGSPAEGCGGGDFLSRWGQNWGIPLYRWDHMEAGGFAWWRRRIARLTEIFHMFRLDHILGFYRIYAFPWRPEENGRFLGLSDEEAAAHTGGRLPRWFLRPDDTVENRAANRADGDVRLRSILAGFDQAEVIAEDLGWVPDYVRPHLHDLDIAGYRIPHWDCDAHGNPLPANCFPELSFATYSTHDHDSLAGIWRGCRRTLQRRRDAPHEVPEWVENGSRHTLRILSRFAGMPEPADDAWPDFTEGVQWRLFKALFASNARYAALMVTELFALEDRINEPGTSGGNNWRFRLPWTLEEIRNDPKLAGHGSKLMSIIGITRRWNEGS